MGFGEGGVYAALPVTPYLVKGPILLSMLYLCPRIYGIFSNAIVAHLIIEIPRLPCSKNILTFILG